MIEKNEKNIISNISSNISSKKNKALKNKKLFGLWVYLMSDCIMFAVLFSVYAIISSNISIKSISYQFFDISSVLLETFVLLLSSLSCGLVIISMNQKKIKMIYFYLTLTFLLGVIFLFMEVKEFFDLIEKNFGPSQHAFFSIFFTLVGIHGIHIFFGLLLILSIFYQIKILGLTHVICTRILCFSLFWHFLDIIWICIFTFVYLNGVI